MQMQDKNTLKKLVIKQIINDYNIIKEKSKGETLYAFGLGLVEDITGFFSAGNSLEVVKQQIENDEFDDSCLWYISEWGYEGGNDNSVYEFLQEIVKNLDWQDAEYENIRKEYEQILIEALKECKDNGIFDEQIVIYLHYADAFDEEIDDISAKIINSTEVYNAFKNRWLEDKNNNLTKIILEKVNR